MSFQELKCKNNKPVKAKTDRREFSASSLVNLDMFLLQKMLKLMLKYIEGADTFTDKPNYKHPSSAELNVLIKSYEQDNTKPKLLTVYVSLTHPRLFSHMETSTLCAQVVCVCVSFHDGG